MADIANIPACQAFVKGKVNENEKSYSALRGQ